MAKRAEWDVDLWVKFKRTGSLDDLDSSDPDDLDAEIARYLHEDIRYDGGYWREGGVMENYRDRYFDENLIENMDAKTPYVRSFEIDRVDMWEVTYRWVESVYGLGTGLNSRLTTAEGFVLFKAICGAMTAKDAVQVAYTYLQYECLICGTLEMELMR